MKTEGLILRSRSRGYGKGEKANSCMKLDERNKAKKSDSKLQRSDRTSLQIKKNFLVCRPPFMRKPKETVSINETENENYHI